MTRRHCACSFGMLAMAMGAAVLAGCRHDRTPRRVPDDGAPCSAIMPEAPESGEGTFRLGGVTLTERAWSVRVPDGSVDPPKDFTTYVVRRGTLPAGAALRDAALLDAAAARVVRGIELGLGDGTKPTVTKVSTDAGDAVDLRWPAGRLRNAPRLLLIPGGHCEATILGAPGDDAVTAYFGSVRVRP
jgi:hypothetical protein